MMTSSQFPARVLWMCVHHAIISILVLGVHGTETLSPDEQSIPDCIQTYQELERVIIKDANIDSMTDGFYPPNQQATTAANIYYYISGQPSEYYVYKFRWSASSVLELIRPELLQDLSLFLYHGRTESIKVVIPPLCAAPTIALALQSNSDEVCWNEDSFHDVDHPVHLLNKLTTFVSAWCH